MKFKKLVSESYEVSNELANRLNSVLADEWLANQFYILCTVAMKGKKQNELDDVAKENALDELDDHYTNLYKWMQANGVKVVTSPDEYKEITNCTKFDVQDGESTSSIVKKLIQSEEEAIGVYSDLIPDTELDLNTMLCGFLKDEREHLKKLNDILDDMSDQTVGSDEKIDHLDDDGNVVSESDDGSDVLEATMKIGSEESEYADTCLHNTPDDLDEPKHDDIMDWEAEFEDGLKCSIAICTTEEDCYVDSVLYGSTEMNPYRQLVVGEPRRGKLAGDYEFEYGGKKYICHVITDDSWISNEGTLDPYFSDSFDLDALSDNEIIDLLNAVYKELDDVEDLYKNKRFGRKQSHASFKNDVEDYKMKRDILMRNQKRLEAIADDGGNSGEGFQK